MVGGTFQGGDETMVNGSELAVLGRIVKQTLVCVCGCVHYCVSVMAFGCPGLRPDWWAVCLALFHGLLFVQYVPGKMDPQTDHDVV